MERVVQRFNSHAQADEADRRYYQALTPEQRLDILFDLISRFRDEHDEASEGFERVYRVAKLGER